MIDIVERLRCRHRGETWHINVMDEAADEIERLRELLRMSYPEQHAEIERLRAALTAILAPECSGYQGATVIARAALAGTMHSECER